MTVGLLADAATPNGEVESNASSTTNPLAFAAISLP
jgi:hypothetical protein